MQQWTKAWFGASARMLHLRRKRRAEDETVRRFGRNDISSLGGEDDYGSVGGFVFYGLQGIVGLIEGEDLDLRLDVDFGG